MSNSNKSRVALEAENYELKQKIKLSQTKYKRELDELTTSCNNKIKSFQADMDSLRKTLNTYKNEFSKKIWL